jgi:urea transport system substrate-binding protein
MTKKNIFFALALFFSIISIFSYTKMHKNPIKVGVLFSLSGTMSMSEIGVSRAVLAAVEEINQNGGILGRRLEPIVADGASDPKVFAKEADKLIRENGVEAIFGCWTSASRKEVKQVVENYGNLLFYPVQYEGVESSSAIVYLGFTPNQQILPAMNMMGEKYGKKIFVVGSDYIYPRMAGEHISDFAKLIGQTVVGSEYKKIGSADFGVILKQIQTLKPDYIINTLNGDSNVAFFEEYARVGFVAQTLPVISFSVGENEILQIAKKAPKSALVGQYAVWSFFDSTGKNSSLKKKMTQQGVKYITDPMQTAYASVYLYKQAIEEAHSSAPSDVITHIVGQTIPISGGKISINSKNAHAYKEIKIGRLNGELEFDTVWSVDTQVSPEPFFRTRSKEQWQKAVDNFYESWGYKWAAE